MLSESNDNARHFWYSGYGCGTGHHAQAASSLFKVPTIQTAITDVMSLCFEEASSIDICHYLPRCASFDGVMAMMITQHGHYLRNRLIDFYQNFFLCLSPFLFSLFVLVTLESI